MEEGTISTRTNGAATSRLDSDVVQNALSTFKYLLELKQLQSPKISDISKYDQVLWLDDIPHERGCYTLAWHLLRAEGEPEKDAWIEIYKPKLQVSPELPDGVEPFVKEEQLENSSLEEPQLLEMSNDLLIRHFYADDEDFEPEKEVLQIDEHEEVFEKYIAYVDENWTSWANQRKNDADSSKEPPLPPEELKPWLNLEELGDFNAKEPVLLEHITVEYDRRAEHAREELTRKWQEYIEKKWKPWAQEDQRLQRIQKVYNKLYTIYQRQQRLGEQFEVVLAFGFLAWNAPRSGTVRRHVLSVQSNVEFDAARGVITVGPTADGNKPILESEMLDTAERPQEQEMVFLQGQVEEMGEDFWDQARLRSVIEGFANALASDTGGGLESKAKYKHDLARSNAAQGAPVISLAPALILRRRSQRGFIQLLNNIGSYIAEGGEIPAGILEFVSEGSAGDSIEIDPDSRVEEREEIPEQPLTQKFTSLCMPIRNKSR